MSVMAEITFETQSTALPVVNFDTIVSRGEVENKRHGDLLPNTVRSIVCGPSNCGKTNSVLSLLTHPNGLRFENVYVFSKSLTQPKYTVLKQMLERVKGVGFFTFQDHEDVLSPDHAKANSVFIFDDVALEKHNTIRAYFCMGRHKLVDCFYLGQSYSRIPKHLVRDNANFLIVFKQDDLNLRHIYDDHVNTDMRFAQFKEICSACWDGAGRFLVIDKDSDLNNGRYRKGFDCFISINKMNPMNPTSVS